MSYYYAKFKKLNEVLIRKNTRIYLNDKKPDRNDGQCLGIVIAKNPGSASPKEMNIWTELDLRNDRMLPSIANIFKKAFDKVDYFPKRNDYIRILNLFNICSPNVNKALSYICDDTFLYIEKASNDLKETPLIFLSWGDEVQLNHYRELWLTTLKEYSKKCFYVTYKDIKNLEIAYGLPTIGAKVKHPQGLPHDFVIDTIGKIYKKNSS